MRLLTKSIRSKLPELLKQDNKGDEAIAYVKYFAPWSNLSWFAIEFDGDDTFFGMVSGDYIEYGSFSLPELESIRGPCGLRVERDKFFAPMSLGSIKKMLKSGT